MGYKKKKKNKNYLLGRLFFLLALFFLLFSIIQVGSNLIKLVDNRGLIDFSVYYQALQVFFQGKNPYQYLYWQSHQGIPFNYPPGFLVIFSVFALLPFKISEIIFIIFSFTCFIATFLLIEKIDNVQEKSLTYRVVIISLLIQTFPFKFTISLGQINAVTLFLVVFSLFLYKKNRLFLSSLFLAISASLKLSPLIILLLFWQRKKIKYILTTITIFLLLNLISFSFFSYYFFNLLLQLASSASFKSFYDQSLLSFFIRLFNNFLLAKTTTYIVGGTIIFFILKKNSSLYKKSYLLLALISILTPFSWQHYLIFSYPLLFSFYKKSPLFYLFWFLFFFHFKNQSNFLLKNPLIISYQTLLILVMVILPLIKKDLSSIK